jgi:mRNA interferase MazF
VELRLDLRGARGHEQRGRRFESRIQATQLALLSVAVVAPTSTRSAREASFRAEVIGRADADLVLCDQVRARRAPTETGWAG